MQSIKQTGRRRIVKAFAAGVAGGLALQHSVVAATEDKTNGRIKQSLCRWCYNKMSLEQLAEAAVKFGYKSIELLNPGDYLKIKPYGLTCAMLNGAGTIGSCLNRVENHARVERDLRKAIDFAAAEKLTNVICFSGNRGGMDDETGLKNCAIGLKRVVGHAETKGITICMELLNSKVDHKDYMCDKTPWGVALCKNVGSPRLKLLYDIYHMQIMEGDVIRTIRDYKEHIAHFHTGGVPGRHEIDDTQELYYPAVMKAIADTGFTGHVAQEFIPARNAVTSMGEAFKICDV